MRRLILLVAALGWLGQASALALDDPSEMLPDAAQEKRAAAIGAQLRCLVCQNESIEDSSAGLARDLRHVVRQHVAMGESDAQIMQWMTRRYGEFIRLRPRLSVSTFILWSMPVLALALGLGAAWAMLRRNHAALPLDAAEQARLDRLLRDDGDKR